MASGMELMMQNAPTIGDVIDTEKLNARIEERDRCARLLELRQDDVRLMAGEVTAQEMRTIMAVLSCLRVRMRSNAYVTVKEGKERDV